MLISRPFKRGRVHLRSGFRPGRGFRRERVTGEPNYSRSGPWALSGPWAFAALEAIHHATSGLPRKVNLLAHHALTAAALAKGQAVSADHVQAALPEVS